MPPVPYLRDSRAIVTCPINLAKLEERDCSCLVRFSTTFLCRIWTDLAWELKVEGLSTLFLIFSFSLSGVLFLFFGTVSFWSF